MGQRVYSFDCKPPVRGGDELHAQVRLGHNYYNKLIEIERRRREAYHMCCAELPALVDFVNQIEALEGLLIDARVQAGDERVDARSRRGASEETRQAFESIINDLTSLRSEFKLAVANEKRSNDSFVGTLELIEAASRAEAKAARGEYSGDLGLYWGTYLVVEASVEQARKAHRPPGFSHWDGHGQVAVQLQHGLPVADAFSDDTRLQIDPIPPEAWTGTRGDRRRLTRTKVRIRVGRDGAKPVWAELPVVIHRQLPPDGQVMWARIHVSKVAAHMKYRLQLTIKTPGTPMAKWDSGKRVGIDLGWRWQDKIRVAYTVDSDGRGEPVTLPNDIIEACDKSRSLRAIRDRNFNEARDRLADWISRHPVPEWMTEATKTLRLWRSAGRLAVVAIRWRTARFDGDAKGFDPLETWRKQDKHLWEWEANNRRKAIARRTEVYRVWAAGIAKKYSLVAIEDFVLSEMAHKEKVEEVGEYDDLARAQRIVSAPSLLRSALINACSSRGVPVVKVWCDGTTITCHACGKETRWDAAAYLSHRCECGAIWDQDHNAGVNILRAGECLAAEGEALARNNVNKIATVPTGRWQKRKAAKAEAMAARKA